MMIFTIYFSLTFNLSEWNFKYWQFVVYFSRLPFYAEDKDSTHHDTLKSFCEIIVHYKHILTVLIF